MIGLARVTSVPSLPLSLPLPLSSSLCLSFFLSIDAPRWRDMAAAAEEEKEGISSVGGFGLDKSADARSLLPTSPLSPPSSILELKAKRSNPFWDWKMEEQRGPFVSPSSPLPPQSASPSISRFESKNTRSRAPKPINCLRGEGKESRRFRRSRRDKRDREGGRTTQRPDGHPDIHDDSLSFSLSHISYRRITLRAAHPIRLR